MDLLPDDVILEVLQYLDVRDLLAFRRVCKRLGALVLAGRVWRHRELRLDGRPPNGSLRVPPASPRERGPLHLLRVAPCLDHLHICAAAGTLRALTTTKCAVASLTLENNHLSFNAQVYAEVVGHQGALGRLRRVHLIFSRSADVCGVLLDALTTLPRLESLTCSMGCPSTRASTALVPRPSAPSLRKFSWPLTRGTEPFVQAVLAGHSATLEDVELRLSYSGWTSWTDDTVAPLLAALPKLHSLRLNYPNLPGLPAVAACRALRKLCVDSIMDKYSTVVELLRRAKQLRDVRLQLDWSGLGCEVLEALASPALERLELQSGGNTEAPPLLRALTTLPALRHLVLRIGDYFTSSLTAAAARDLLQGITPATAPALRTLELKMGREPCPHAWVHEDAVRRSAFSSNSWYSRAPKCGAIVRCAAWTATKIFGKQLSAPTTF
ncbi:uncharacterized protein LOC127751295 [Frankliniella occidentalis]|uniref:Uncharacterized protein LOC127751295 n=1 Tax=Frankliniella occidentalis TaxID=133901 RepID=A0A9C6X7B4_FRAOC|nr:uncharacterized protein LOC127751295 [Frankliniella occidentalis]